MADENVHEENNCEFMIIFPFKKDEEDSNNEGKF